MTKKTQEVDLEYNIIVDKNICNLTRMDKIHALEKCGKMLSNFTVATCVLLHIALKNVELYNVLEKWKKIPEFVQYYKKGEI